MRAIELIQAAQRLTFLNEDEKPVALKLLPPLTQQEIVTLASQVGLPLPEELQTLLTFCSGIDGKALPEPIGEINFTGANMMFEAKEMFPNGLPIAQDGFGNFWLLDITPHTTRAAPVFFACHDAPEILYQSPDLASFLDEVFRLSQAPHESLISAVHEDRLFEVWSTNPGVIERADAITATDQTLKDFALELPPYAQIIDLRSAPPGMGFSWGRYGAETVVRRHGYERIFAYLKPPTRTGFLARFF